MFDSTSVEFCWLECWTINFQAVDFSWPFSWPNANATNNIKYWLIADLTSRGAPNIGSAAGFETEGPAWSNPPITKNRAGTVKEDWHILKLEGVLLKFIQTLCLPRLPTGPLQDVPRPIHVFPAPIEALAWSFRILMPGSRWPGRPGRRTRF